MKKIFLITLMFASIVGFTQSLPIIPGYTNLNSKNQLQGMKPPPDTTYSKYGLGQIGDSLWLGNGVKWNNVGRASAVALTGIQSILTALGNVKFVNDTTFTTTEIPYLYGWNQESARLQYNKSFKTEITDFQTGDELYMPDSNTIANRHTANQCQTRWESGLNVTRVGITHTFFVSAGYYWIGCTKYRWDGGYVTLPNVVTDSYQTYIIMTVAGATYKAYVENSDPQLPSLDLDNEIPRAQVLVNADNSIDISQLIIWDENTESTFATGGTITSSVTSGNTQSGTLKIQVTAANNNAYFQLTRPDTIDLRSYNNVSFGIQNVAALAAASNWSIQLYLNNTAISQEILLTNEGYHRTIDASSYQQITIPTAHFTTGTAGNNFNRVRVRRKGTGSVNARFDLFYMDRGLTIINDNSNGLINIFERNDSVFTTSADGTTTFAFLMNGGGASLLPITGTATATGNSSGNLNGYTAELKGGTIRLGHIDSMGAVINYFLPTNPVNGTLTVSGTTPTVNGTKMTINGTTKISFPYLSGAENWEFTLDSVVTKVSSNAEQNLIFEIIPSSNSALFTRKIKYLGADSARYLNYYKNDGATTPDFSTRSINRLVTTTNDTLRFTGRSRQGKLLFSVYNYRTGQTIELTSDQAGATPGYYDIANIGTVSIESKGNFEFFGSFKYYVDEPKNVKVIFTGDSHTIGSGVPFIQKRFADISMQKYSNTYSIYAGSGETSADAITRIPEIIAASTAGTVVVWNYSTNDPGNSITAIQNATNLKRFLDSMDAHGIITVIGTPIPQATNMTTYKDSTVAIAIRRAKEYADLFTNLKDGNGGGTDRNLLWDFDGVHLNYEGNVFIASLFEKVLRKYLTSDLSIVADNISKSNDIEDVVGIDYHNHLSTFDFGSSNKYLRNIGTPNTPSAAQSINVNGSGQFVWNVGATAGIDNFVVASSGNYAHPELNIQQNLVAAPILTSDDITIGAGTNMHLTTAAAYINTPVILQALTSISLDTTNYKPIVQKASDKTLYVMPWSTFGGGGGASAFTGLSDVPGSYSGQANKIVMVNGAANALIFVDTTGLFAGGGGGGGGANTALSNLASVAINTHLLPASSGSANLGSTSKPFGNLYLPNSGTIDFNSGASTITTTGTGGVQVNTGVTGFVVNGGGGAGFIGLSGAYSQISGNASDFYLDVAQSAKDLILRIGGATERWRFNGTTGALVPASGYNIGSTSAGVGTIYWNAGNANIHSTGSTTTSELVATDGSGNNTTISPHAQGNLPYKLKPLGWTFNSSNDKYGSITVDMLKAMETIEQQSKEIEELKSMVYQLMNKKYDKKKPIKVIYKKSHQ